MNEIFQAIHAERERQNRLHPEFQEELRMEILTEEVGEVARAKLENDTKQMIRELTEVAAVAVRWIERLKDGDST